MVICSNRAIDILSGVCSMHTEDALEESRHQDELSRMRNVDTVAETSSIVSPELSVLAEEKKRIRVSAPKRMINPFGLVVCGCVLLTNLF